MKHITTLHTHGRTFEIVHYDGHYCAVEDKYIDADGKLNTALCGPELHVGSTAAQCIESAKLFCKVEDLVANGIDALTACVMAAGDMDYDKASKMTALYRQ